MNGVYRTLSLVLRDRIVGERVFKNEVIKSSRCARTSQGDKRFNRNRCRWMSSWSFVGREVDDTTMVSETTMRQLTVPWKSRREDRNGRRSASVGFVGGPPKKRVEGLG